MSKQEIFYNGYAVLSGLPTPYVGKSTEYIRIGERWGQSETWSLNGFITGCDKDSLELSRQSVLGDFSQGFGQIEIGTGITLNPVRINNISFDSSEYIGSIPYTIEFSYYPSSSFSGFNFSGYFGVIEPSDEIVYSENPDGTMDISRNISAVGFTTDADNINSALDNAKNFIHAYSGIWVNPFIISTTGTDLTRYLVSTEESFDRLSNRASLNQKFKTDLLNPRGSLVHRYTVGITENYGQYSEVNYNGQIDVGRYGELEDAREAYVNFKNSIDTTFVTKEEVTEDPYINRLTYNFGFLSGEGVKNIPEIADDFTITVSEDAGSSLFQASINGTLTPNYGCLGQRYVKLLNSLQHAKEANYHYDLMVDIYEDFYKTSRGSKQNRPQQVFLNPKPLSYEESTSEKNITASYSASFNDRFIPSEFSDDEAFDLKIDFKPPIRQRAIKESFVGGKYICQDLGVLSRENISVSIDKRGVEQYSLDNLKEYASVIFNQFKNGSEEAVEGNSNYASGIERTETYQTTRSYKNDEEFDIT